MNYREGRCLTFAFGKVVAWCSMGLFERRNVVEKAFGKASSRVEVLANIAFGREVTRRVVDPILPLNDIANGPTFYCVHGVTGCATDFRFMAEMLGSTVKFYGIQSPTVKRNADFAASIEQIARYYAERLNEFQPTGPLILGGHSVGAAIALEMAQQLRALGRDIRLLVVFDGELFNTGAEISVFNPIYWIKILLNSPRWVRDVLLAEYTWHTFLKTAPRKITATAKSAIAGLVGKRANHAVEAVIHLRNFTPDHAAFVRTLHESQFKYIPKEYDGRVAVCVARTLPLAYLPQVEATWRKIAPGALVAKFKGTHASLVFPNDGSTVAEYLTSVLREIIEEPIRELRDRGFNTGLHRVG